MSEERREAQRQSGLKKTENLISAAECLRRREAWKYTALKEYLKDRRYQFEFEIERFVFDLALLDEHILVEFDGSYHGGKQLETDAKKDAAAEAAGFRIVRRTVEEAMVIAPSTIAGL